MNKTLKALPVLLTALLLPAISFAQAYQSGYQYQPGYSNQEFSSLQNTLITLTGFMNQLIPFIIGIAFVWFLFGLIKYVVAKDETTQKEARGVIIWGVVILFVMVSVWGLVNVLKSTFQLDNNVPNNLPKIPVRTQN